jgi:transcriptional regulator with XRE-family HTH domain
MDLRHRFATNLRRIRNDRGISQEDLAYEAGVNRAYVSGIERAVTYLGLEIIGKFAEVLRVDPAQRRQQRSAGTTCRVGDHVSSRKPAL